MDGDMLAVKFPVGEIRIEAKVTPRIVPGTVGIPQGAWHKADMFGDKDRHGWMREHVDRLQTVAPCEGQRNCSLDDCPGFEGVRG